MTLQTKFQIYLLKLYADDAKIGREIKSMQDCVDLQSYLNIFTRWSDIWLFVIGTKF